jgi:tetratricopeptide (TPR) repeat protein
MRKAFAAAVVLCVLGAVGAGARDVARPPENDAARWTQLDALVADAKTSMMANPNVALRTAQAAEAIAQAIAPSSRQNEAVATSLWLESEALTRVGKPDQARAILDKAIRIAGSDGKLTKLDGDLALSTARLADSSGDVALALKSYQKAHDIFAHLGEARSQSMALQGLGSIYDEAHDFTREIHYYDEAARVYSQDPALELSVANNVGFAQQQLGQYDAALKNFQRALELCRQRNSPFLEANILSSIAVVNARQHRFAEATAAANQALKLIGTKDENGDAPRSAAST